MAVPRLERLEQTLVAAYVPAANAALQSLQEGIHKAVLPVQRAVDEFSTYVSAKAKPREYVPSGVRPRLLLLPCVVLSIMTIPILSIFLPVYFKADHDSRQEAKNFISVCTVFPTPDEVVVAAYQKPMSSANQSLISIFMQQLQTECQQVRQAWLLACMCMVGLGNGILIPVLTRCMYAEFQP